MVKLAPLHQQSVRRDSSNVKRFRERLRTVLHFTFHDSWERSENAAWGKARPGQRGCPGSSGQASGI